MSEGHYATIQAEDGSGDLCMTVEMKKPGEIWADLRVAWPATGEVAIALSLNGGSEIREVIHRPPPGGATLLLYTAQTWYDQPPGIYEIRGRYTGAAHPVRSDLYARASYR